jgi:hypothetical protein
MHIGTFQILDIQLLDVKLMELHIKLGFKWVFAIVRLRLHVSCIHVTCFILQVLLKVNNLMMIKYFF